MEENSQNTTPSLVRSLDSQFNEIQVDNMRDRKTTHRKLPIKLFGKIIIGLLVFVLAVAVLGYFLLFIPGKRILASVNKVQASAMQAATLAKSQDLTATKNQLVVVKQDLDTLKTDFQALKWMNVLPLVRNYYLDGNRGFSAASELLAAADLTVQSIEPYADIIGLKGISQTGDGAKTAQDRINFIINTLDKVKPQLTEIGSHLSQAKSQVDQINPNRYPKSFRGIEVRSQLAQGILLLDQASTIVNDAKPLLEQAPYMLGMDSPRKYLLIFENDAELRPTGGFMTAYAVLSVDKGKISTVLSDDIYNLDAKFTKKIPAPDPIKKYLPNVPYWYLRDQNLSPDFRVSMETFYPNYQLTKSPEVDGIIAVDTQVLVDLLKITGRIGVPGFGNFSGEDDPRCNCPQVFYELELFADVEGPVVWDSVSGRIVTQPKNYGQRKSFIGPMMYSVLANVMSQPKTKMGELFNTSLQLISSKHIQFYFTNTDAQNAVETFNMAGRLRDYSGDYLMVVDTNFAGAKTNAWVNYDAQQEVNIGSDGTVTKTLALTYKNPQHYFQDEATKLRLNGVFRDWLRVYVPEGSQLIEAKGFETGQTVSEDLGKTVFEGFFTVTPLNVKTITFKYTLPMKMTSPYQLLIQKQAGAKDFIYQTKINGRKQPELVLSSDKELSVSY